MKFELNFRYFIFQIIAMIDGVNFCELALRWMSLDLTNDKSILVKVMAWCRQATSHYLSQCWSRSLSPYGITRPHSIKHIKFHTREYEVEITWWVPIIEDFLPFDDGLLISRHIPARKNILLLSMKWLIHQIYKNTAIMCWSKKCFNHNVNTIHSKLMIHCKPVYYNTMCLT